MDHLPAMQEFIDFWKEKFISRDINEEDIEILNIIDPDDRRSILRAVPDLKMIFRELSVYQGKGGKLFFQKVGMPLMPQAELAERHDPMQINHV